MYIHLKPSHIRIPYLSTTTILIHSLSHVLLLPLQPLHHLINPPKAPTLIKRKVAKGPEIKPIIVRRVILHVQAGRHDCHFVSIDGPIVVEALDFATVRQQPSSQITTKGNGFNGDAYSATSLGVYSSFHVNTRRWNMPTGPSLCSLRRRPKTESSWYVMPMSASSDCV
jgi:hypothetical protein